MILENNETKKNIQIRLLKPAKQRKQPKNTEKENKQKPTPQFAKIKLQRQKSQRNQKTPKEKFLVTETNKICKDNLRSILSHEMAKDKKTLRSKSLFRRHNIDSGVRAKMVDWMIEVLSSFNCTENTFFVSVDIMDSYIAKTNRTIKPGDIHLIGVTSMLLASKMEEILPFKISTVVKKMTHNKMTKSMVSDCETDILLTLNFKLLERPSLFVFVEFLLSKIYLHEKKEYKKIMEVVRYITKMVIHDITVMTRFSLKYIAASCVYICLKIIEQVDFDLDTKKIVGKVKGLLGLDEQVFFESSEMVLSLAKNFEMKFSFAKNLLKFDSFNLSAFK